MAQLSFVLLCVVVTLYQTDCVDSTSFKTIPGGGNRRTYWFSQEDGEDTRTWDQARHHCQELRTGADLATAGHFHATGADPLLEYMRENNKATSWIGAHKVGSKWMWTDGRELSYYSNLWGQNEPSGDGGCVDTWSDKRRNYFNDLPCNTKRHFVCEKNV